MSLRVTVLLVTVAALVTGCAATPSGTASNANRLEVVRARDQLIVGVKFDSPPYGWFNPETGNAEGFDVDIARQIAAHILGSEDKIKFLQVLTANRIPLLQQGDIDIVVATMSSTPDRAKQIDFSIPYFPSGMGILVLEGSPVTKPADLAGKTNCQTTGAVSNDLVVKALKADYGITDTKLMEVGTYPECIEALKSDRADFIGTDQGTLIGLSTAVQGVRVLPVLLDFVPWVIGVAKGNPQLLAAVNEAIKASFDSGAWDAAYKKWTGNDAPKGWRDGTVSPSP